MRRFTVILLALSVLLYLGCNEEVVGPEPQMADDPDELATDPSFVCNEAHGEDGTWVTLSGDAFSPLVVDAIASERDPDVELPTVSLIQRLTPEGEDVDSDDATALTLESPLGVDRGDVRWLDDQTLQFRITDDLDLSPGVYDIRVENPNGQTATETEAVGVLPRPELDAVIPEMTCVAQGERQVTLQGEHFLISPDDEYPTVAIEDQQYEVTDVSGCTDLHDVYAGHQLCSQATAQIDEASLEAGTHDVTLENIPPADCPSIPEEDEVTIHIVDPPVVDDIQPSPICSEQLDYQEVEISGEGFVVLGGDDYPEVRIGDQTYQPDGADGCSTVDEAPSMDAEKCTGLTVSIAAGDFADEVDDDEFVTQVDVEVENPEPVGCHSTEDTTLGVTPPPTLTSVEPRAVCNNDGSVTFDVTGDHLLEIDGETPQILVDGNEYDTDVAECTDIEQEDGVRACAELSVDVAVEGDGLKGAYGMVAINPEPAACESAPSEQFYAAGPPNITDAEPDGLCLDAEFEGDLHLFGQFLVDPDGDELIVEVEGEEVGYELTGCDSAIDDYDLDLCGGIDTNITGDLLDDLEDADSIEVAVTGAEPLACGTSTFELERTEPPTIDYVEPSRVCSEGSTFTVHGEDLHEDAEAYLDGVAAEEVDVAADGESAEVTFSDDLDAGWATFEFVNPGDCGSEFEEDIRVTDGPLPVFVDPRVVFNQMTTRVTVYAAGLYGGTVDEVELIHPDGTTTVVDHSYDPDRPQVIQADVPEGILDEVDDDDLNEDGTADFGVRLTDQEIECSNEADDLVTVTDELTLALDSIDPPFGATDQSTGVEIFASTDLEGDEVGFEATPRAYLNPVDDGVGTVGREIRALQFIDETELNGVVPSGLNVGMYDLIVVNPEGEVGVLDAAFEVTEERPPEIHSVSPASWPNDEAALSVDIEGQYFRDDPDDPTVEVFCRQAGDETTDEADLDQPPIASLEFISDSLVEIAVDTNDLAAESACYMRLTNADGTYDEYSPITVTNPAENAVSFQHAPSFDTARRGPTTLAGSPTRKSHYLYVVGGDDGDESGAFRTGEFSRINRFGVPVEWNYLPEQSELPSGRTLADGVRLDDFIYLVGGSDEGEVTDEILRARVLDPLDIPEITTIDLDVEDFIDETEDEPSGLDAGTYYYRISAVYSDTDPANPEGESLASEPQPIQLPIDDVEVTISWDLPSHLDDHVDHYRVYRNIEPDDPYGDESLIYITDDAATTSFTDDGTKDIDEDAQPLPLGSLGTWHNVASLNFERKEAGITLAPHPTDDGVYFLYAIAGEDGDEQFRGDYEIVEIDVDGPRQQTVFAASVGTEELPDGQERSRLQAAASWGRNASTLAGVAPQVFSIAGEVSGMGDNNVYVSTVGDDGQLEPWEQIGSVIGGDRRGHAAVAINGYLGVVGGHNGNPSVQGVHAEIQCGGDCPPASTGAWDALPAGDMRERVTMGHIPFRGFWYLTGGLTDGDIPTNTVDYSVAGATP